MSSLAPACSAAASSSSSSARQSVPLLRKKTSKSSLCSSSLPVLLAFLLLLMKLADCAPTTTLAAQTATNEDRLLILFEDRQFKGIRSKLHVGHLTCVNLIGKLNDFFSSVDTLGGCYLLCEHQNCRGRCTRVSGKVEDLAKLGMNDRVSSLQICGEENETNSLEDQEEEDKPTRRPWWPVQVPTSHSFGNGNLFIRRSKRSVPSFSSNLRRNLRVQSEPDTILPSGNNSSSSRRNLKRSLALKEDSNSTRPVQRIARRRPRRKRKGF